MMIDRESLYLAAPWFSPVQAARHDAVLAIAREWQARAPDRRAIYNPRELICPPGADALMRRQVFDANIDAILASQIVVAVTDDKDLGTIFELGYAAALRDHAGRHATLVGVALTLGDRPFNLMLAVACDVVCTELSHLADYLLEGTVRQHEGVIE